MQLSRHAFILGASHEPGLGVELALEGQTRGLLVQTFGRSKPSVRLAEAGIEHVRWDATKRPDLNRAVTRIRGSSHGVFRDKQTVYVVWNLGVYDLGPLAQMTDARIDRLIETHVTALLRFLRRLHPAMSAAKSPYHLIVIGSTSAWKARTQETPYCASKAAEAAIARQFVPELVGDLPGSQVTLVNPGGMQTGFLGQAVTDFHALMPPDKVAKIIWNEAIAQTDPFSEINIIRDDRGRPEVVRGIQTPQAPLRKR